ncbi:MAG: hypothetical protein ACT4SY_04835 [Hyphomicrobiales bacterium]
MTAKLPEDFGRGDRFWYWRGASGRRYIHSIYEARSCPPLPGAVYVAVRRVGNAREALAVGRFPSFLDAFAPSTAGPAPDEIHVHLLARNEADAKAVLADLELALDEVSASQPGLHEEAQPARLAA